MPTMPSRPTLSLELAMRQQEMICDTCGGAVSSADGLIHAVEECTVNGRQEYFAFYAWNEEAAHSGAFNFVHSADRCLYAQMARYLRSGLGWGIMSSDFGANIVGRMEASL